jgi:hypothetical protein
VFAIATSAIISTTNTATLMPIVVSWFLCRAVAFQAPSNTNKTAAINDHFKALSLQYTNSSRFRLIECCLPIILTSVKTCHPARMADTRFATTRPQYVSSSYKRNSSRLFLPFQSAMLLQKNRAAWTKTNTMILTSKGEEPSHCLSRW